MHYSATITPVVPGSHPLAFAEKFLEIFGNDFRLWYCMRRYAKDGAAWLEPLTARLLGESRCVAARRDGLVRPRVRDQDEDYDAFAEARQRIAWQCELAPTS
jgi:hypothetical protein